jgi:hypothetical protein
VRPPANHGVNLRARFDMCVSLGGIITFWFRFAGSRDWHTLGDYNTVDHTGFDPVAVDHERKSDEILRKALGM